MAKKTQAKETTRNPSDALVAKVWGFCNTLRDDGVGASEYLEQLTFLLFLKMSDELGKKLPKEYNWQILKSKSGSDLSEYYTELLNNLAKEPGMIGQIFLQAKNAINTPATLAKIIVMIDRETWSGLDTDLKGDLYEGILEKTAADKKSGAGQYFTARELIKVIVECVRPKPGETVCDPACGTGGFLIIAFLYLLAHYAKEMDIDEKRQLKTATFFGNEIVPTTRRLCLMNMYLHNIGTLDGEPNISLADSLLADPGKRYNLVITNPPFGKKSAQTITNDDGEDEKESVSYNRQDFWASTSNKQLNFVQHIHTILKANGRAAVVLPDNVLFEGGAGETIRRKLMETTDLHTILRLPTGIFYAQGVRANVLFFDARPASKEAQTKEVWVYDYRTNVHHTLKQNPLKASDLAEFVACYNPENRFKRKETWSESNPEGRWRKYTYEEILQREKTSLDIKWLKDDVVTPEDYTLGEVFDELEETRKSVTEAIANLKRMAKGVRE